MWQWLLVVGFALFVWRLAQPAGDCVIRIRRGQVTIRGKLAAGRRAEIERFLTEHSRTCGGCELTSTFREPHNACGSASVGRLRRASNN
jgi:hypothetical protein